MDATNRSVATCFPLRAPVPTCSISETELASLIPKARQHSATLVYAPDKNLAAQASIFARRSAYSRWSSASEHHRTSKSQAHPSQRDGSNRRTTITHRVPLQVGYREQPQKRLPAFAPRLATRSFIGDEQSGHTGISNCCGAPSGLGTARFPESCTSPTSPSKPVASMSSIGFPLARIFHTTILKTVPGFCK